MKDSEIIEQVERSRRTAEMAGLFEMWAVFLVFFGVTVSTLGTGAVELYETVAVPIFFFGMATVAMRVHYKSYRFHPISELHREVSTGIYLISCFAFSIYFLTKNLSLAESVSAVEEQVLPGEGEVALSRSAWIVPGLMAVVAVASLYVNEYIQKKRVAAAAEDDGSEQPG